MSPFHRIHFTSSGKAANASPLVSWFWGRSNPSLVGSHRKGGSVAPWVPIFIVVLVGFVGFTVSDQGPSDDPPTVWEDEGPLTWTPRPTEPGIVANDLRTHLYQIADDSMKGRAAASLGGWKTTEYIAGVFERLGLEPAGDDGWFQTLALGPLAYDRDAVRLIAGGVPLSAGLDWAPLPPTASNAIGGDFAGEGLETVFGGEWGDLGVPLPPSMVRGKAVVFVEPRRRGLATDTRAQDAGAAAVLVASDILSATANNAAFGGRTGLMPSVASTIGGAMISAVAFQQIFDGPMGASRVGASGATLSGSWSYQLEESEYPTRNVIAVLRGSDPSLAGQYVLVGAHNDHVGMVNGPPVDHDSLRAFNRVMRPQGANDRPGAPTAEQQGRIDALIARARSIRPPTLDSVMNGADDDGSGTAVLLEIAQNFATGPAPKRSIVFISHAAEESGLFGSEWFTDHPTIPLDSIVAAHNMDMLGKGRVTDVQFGGPNSVQMLGARRLSAEFGDIIDSINAVRDEPMAIDYSWDRSNKLNRFCRSDQVNYFRFAIPVTYFSLGYAQDYHQATDEARYIDFEHGAKLGRFIAEIMRTIADRPTRLRVLPPGERDLSANC